MYFLTEDGLYELAGGRAKERCCRGVWLVDGLRWRGELYLCSPDVGVLSRDGEVVLRGECWALRDAGGLPVASLGGPRLVNLESGGVVADYSKLAEERHWYFPEPGYKPHFTDLAKFLERWVASAEVGDLMAGPALGDLTPAPLYADQHVLHVAEGRLLIGTASGIYFTEDLRNFEEANGAWGYVHGIVKCPGLYVAQEMSPKPLWVSKDGVVWDNLPMVLESPTFGSTNIACAGDVLVYAFRRVYYIDLAEAKAEALGVELPRVYKIVV